VCRNCGKFTCSIAKVREGNNEAGPALKRWIDALEETSSE